MVRVHRAAFLHKMELECWRWPQIFPHALLSLYVRAVNLVVVPGYSAVTTRALGKGWFPVAHMLVARLLFLAFVLGMRIMEENRLAVLSKCWESLHYTPKEELLYAKPRGCQASWDQGQWHHCQGLLGSWLVVRGQSAAGRCHPTRLSRNRVGGGTFHHADHGLCKVN